MPYYRRIYSYKKPAYKARTYRKSYFPRKTFNGIQSYKPTGNMFKSIFNISAAHATSFNSSFVLDPLYIMYNDARFATWRSMYDEYRMCKVQFIISPLHLDPTAVADANTGCFTISAWDRNGSYQTTTDVSTTITQQNVLALEGAKYEQYWIGATMKKIYQTILPVSQENMWLNTQFAPNTSSASQTNIGPFFDPNLYINTQNGKGVSAGSADVIYAIELKIWVEGRGQRFIADV